MSERSLSIAGAGLAGALLATLLARRGWRVDVYERRADPRRAGDAGGRSINLALAERGLAALRAAAVDEAVLAEAVMMRGRMVHGEDGTTRLLRYGRDDSEVIWSVHRGRLNRTLISAAEAAGAHLHFGQRLVQVDFENGTMRLHDDVRDAGYALDARCLIGADGAGSALRAAMAAVAPLGERFEPLGHGYKELEIPPDASGRHRMEPNALHIWPRGGYMCIALPNADGSFTVTLFLPNEGEPSFARVTDGAAALAFFREHFADALPLIPELAADFERNPVGLLGTLRLRRWHLGGRALLIGDAAHAIVPFHGQGMNCAFEDCVELAGLLESLPPEEAFPRFEQARRANAEAIAEMALENYVEMRDLVDDSDFLLRKQVEAALAERHPGRFVPRYAMVSFRRTPYALARERGEVQRAILHALCDGRRAFAEVDLARGDAMVRERLVPLGD